MLETEGCIDVLTLPLGKSPGLCGLGLVVNNILGLYRDSGKENRNYYIIIGYIIGLYYIGNNVLRLSYRAHGPRSRL